LNELDEHRNDTEKTKSLLEKVEEDIDQHKMKEQKLSEEIEYYQ
jgi:hypothetical protein